MLFVKIHLIQIKEENTGDRRTCRGVGKDPQNLLSGKKIYPRVKGNPGLSPYPAVLLGNPMKALMTQDNTLTFYPSENLLPCQYFIILYCYC